MESSITFDRPKTRIIIHKGATISTGQYSNERFDYTIDSEVPADLMPRILDDVDAIIDEKVSKQKASITTQTANNPPATTDLNKLPWMKYADGSGEWIFADTKGAETLLANIEISRKETWQDTEYLYKLSRSSRTNRSFIRRLPKKHAK